MLNQITKDQHNSRAVKGNEKINIVILFYYCSEWLIKFQNMFFRFLIDQLVVEGFVEVLDIQIETLQMEAVVRGL